MNLFGRAFRDHVKKQQRLRKSAKKFTTVSVQYKTNGPLIKVPHFQNKMGAIRNSYRKSLITKGKVVVVKSIKTEDSLVKKMQQKGNFLQQKNSSVKKTQQGRNLY